jgi:4'-phosphopantetheinyl transferase
MPLVKIVKEVGRIWSLWEITEEESALHEQLSAFDTIPNDLHHPTKRKEWYAGRLLVKEMTSALGLPYAGITKNSHGKPFLKNHAHQLSLSHSYPYVASIIDEHHAVGIDLEQPKPKLLNIASRILHPQELADAGDDIIKHCIYWSAKETLIKVFGKKHLTLCEQLLISPFNRESQGSLTGKIIADGNETTIPLAYFITDQYVLVFSKSGSI